MTTEKDRGLSSILKAAGGGDPGARDRLFDLVFSVGWDRKLDAQDRKGLEGLLSYMERPP
jgi:hypothetical protein